MDAEKVKEIVFDVLDSHISLLQCIDNLNEYHKARLVAFKEGLSEIKASFAQAEKAEQKSWKDLPLCSEERGKLVADRIDPCPWYNYWLCAYHRCQEGDIIFHRCALPIDEPAADPEPLPESRANARDRLEGMIERVEERVKILEAADSLDDAHLDELENWKKGHIYGHPTACSIAVNKKRIEDVEKRLCNHLKMHVEVEK